MTNYTNPFAFVKEQIDPIIASANENGDFLVSDLVSLFYVEDYTGMQPDQAGYVDVYQPTAFPAINISDYWQYAHGDRTLQQGRIKFEKMTISCEISEDEFDRMAQIGYADSIIAKMVIREMKDDFINMMTTIELYLIDPWAGATTDASYNSSYNGMLKSSSTTTLSAPADLNASAGTPAAWGSTVILSGTDKTANNCQTLASGIRTGMTRVDAITHREFSFKKIYFVVDPITWQIIKTQHDLLNATTGQISNNVLYDDLLAMGIEVVKSPRISYTYGSNNHVTGIAFADPDEWFTIFRIPPPEGEGWSEWESDKVYKGEKWIKVFEKHRKFEFACMATAFWLNTSARV